MGQDKIKHFKWNRYKKAYTEWWENLTLEQKQYEKNLFEQKRQLNLKKKFPYPDMKDLTKIRISQLSERHICRIHDFKDKGLEFFK